MHLPPESVESSDAQSLLAPLPIPPDWKAAGIGPAESFGGGTPLILRFPAVAAWYTGQPARLRFTLALETKSPRKIGIYLPDPSGSSPLRLVESITIHAIRALQTYDVFLTADAVASVLSGKAIHLQQIEGDSRLFVLAETGPHAPVRQPHLIFEPASEPDTTYCLQKFLERMLSLDGVQPFGPLAGYALDGLLDLETLLGRDRVRPALERYLDTTFALSLYSGSPASPSLAGIEATLPFAALALVRPGSPALSAALSFWLQRSRETPDDGLILNPPRVVSAAGVYTVAYPLAVLAYQEKRPDLEELAVRQILLRRNRLKVNTALYARTRDGFVDVASRNQAEGCAWYLLGMSRALPFFSNTQAADEVAVTLREGCRLALSHQRADGLWYRSMHDSASGIDIAASAGLAAGLARAEALGCAPPDALPAARKTLQTLMESLTSDGLLPEAPTNTTPSSLRTFCLHGMGLLAQLLAALPSPFVAPAVPPEPWEDLRL